MAYEKENDIKILCQTATETLKQQNAAFMAQYPTDEAQIDYYTELAMRLWDEFQIDGAYEVEGTRKNVETWFQNKRKQMELFRKHPYWCEEAKAIIFAQEELRKCDFSQAAGLLNDVRAYIYHKTHCLPIGDHILECIMDTINYVSDEPSVVSPEMTDRFVRVLERKLDVISLPKKASRMVQKGTKISRFVRKCCEEFKMKDGSVIDVTKFEDEHEAGDRTFDSFEKKYAKFADSLSDLKINKMTLLSLNFLDFMTMSNGNSWSSCHYINSHGLFHGGDGGSYHGAYKQGCMSYALDEPSFLLYTLPSDFDGNDYYRCQKLTRMCCQYENGVLVTGKCYPTNTTELITNYRNIAQKIITDIEDAPNKWTFTTDTSRIASLTQTVPGSAHYTDYLRDGQKPTISLCSRLTIDIDNPMKIGHKAYCLHCGREIGDSARNWLQCSYHRKRMVCKCCGKKITDDAYHELGDGLYCNDCLFYCAFHDRWEQRTELHGTIRMKDGDKTVCRESMEHLAQCVDCGVYGRKDRMLKTTNGYACRVHVRKYTKCSMCGQYVLNKEKHVRDNGDAVCEQCKKFLDGAAAAGIRLVYKEKYEVGEYVVMATRSTISDDANGISDEMVRLYPNKIVRVVRSNSYGDNYGFTSLPDDHHDDGRWHWSYSSIKCGIVGVNDSCIGKTLAELGLE